MTGKITSYAAQAAPAAADLLLTVDVSDTSMALTGTDKKLTLATLAGFAVGNATDVWSATAAGTGISVNTNADQSAAINAWILSLPAGSTAWFPPGQYYVQHAIEVPRTIRVAGGMFGYDTPIFVAMTGFADSQIMRNWQSTDTVSTAGPRYAPLITAWNTSIGNNYVNIANLTFEVNGNSNIDCCAFVNVMERSIIENLTFANTMGSGGTGNIGIALYTNGENSVGTCGRFIIRNFQGYGNGWQHLYFLDGTNGGTQSANPLLDVEIVEFTTPANSLSPAVCSDSPIYARYVQGLNLCGHQEMPPLNGTADSAGIRLVNCADVHIYNYWYAPGGGSYRPFLRATSDTGTPGLQGQQVGPTMSNVVFLGNGGWLARTDTGCGVTASSATVTDTLITAGDLYRPVAGPGIPSGTYITAVTAGTGFTMSNAAWRSGTVSLIIGANIIEDETASGGSLPGTGVIRHFGYDASHFSVHKIVSYDGGSVKWLQYQSAPGAVIKQASALGANDNQLAYAPAGAVAESYPRWAGYAAGTAVLTSGTLHLTGVYMYPGDTVTNLTYTSGSQAAVTPAHWWFAFFDTNLNLVAISADQTVAGWASGTSKTLAMTTAWTASVPGLHWAGILVSAATPPSLEALVQENIGSISPPPYGNSSSGLTSPSSCPAVPAAASYVAGRPYVLVT